MGYFPELTIGPEDALLLAVGTLLPHLLIRRTVRLIVSKFVFNISSATSKHFDRKKCEHTIANTQASFWCIDVHFVQAN